MESYWYISKQRKKPKNRGLIKIIKLSKFLIIELSNEVDCDALKRCDLIYIGYGNYEDKHIQKALMAHMK